MSKRIFIICSADDMSARDWLVRHFTCERGRYEFTDCSIAGPHDAEWKTRCREHIKTCRGVLALISRNTRGAHDARWLMECAGEEGKPALGVHIHAEARGTIPPELAGCTVIEWAWSGIDAFLDSLAEQVSHDEARTPDDFVTSVHPSEPIGQGMDRLPVALPRDDANHMPAPVFVNSFPFANA